MRLYIMTCTWRDDYMTSIICVEKFKNECYEAFKREYYDDYLEYYLNDSDILEYYSEEEAIKILTDKYNAYPAEEFYQEWSKKRYSCCFDIHEVYTNI